MERNIGIIFLLLILHISKSLSDFYIDGNKMKRKKIRKKPSHKN